MFPLSAFAVKCSETHAGWWCEETVGSLIRASVNENSQFTKLDAHMHTCAGVHQRGLGAGRRNIRWGIKVYV